MHRRNALAAAAAISLSITGLAAAAGATMHVFDVADASPNVGKVSPVTTSTAPPEVEHHIVVVDDPPATNPPPTANAPVRGSRSAVGRTESPTASDDHGRAATAAPTTGGPVAPSATHEVERELGDD